MNNYSLLQQILHRIILSSKLVREITFDFEQTLFLKKNSQFVDKHVFVAGLARSGTTALLNALHQSNNFASLTYEDMPFILSPNFWSKISLKKKHKKPQERYHKDGIDISTNSAEAFEEVFWKTYTEESHKTNRLFENFVNLILIKNNKERYLSKNNQNIKRLDTISKIFPNSIILIPFREPLDQAFSLLSQHKYFINEQKKDDFVRDYMALIGHSEFGADYIEINSSNLDFPNSLHLNHWLEQWYLTYKSVLGESIENKNLYLIDYRELCNNPNVWTSIKDLTNLKQENNYFFKESKKIIEHDFDEKLSNRCYELYNILGSYSI